MCQICTYLRCTNKDVYMQLIKLNFYELSEYKPIIHSHSPDAEEDDEPEKTVHYVNMIC